VTSALKVNFNVMRSINSLFTYLLYAAKDIFVRVSRSRRTVAIVKLRLLSSLTYLLTYLQCNHN